MHRIISALTLLFFSLASIAQETVLNPGAVTAVHADNTGLDIRTDHAWLRLTIYSPNIVRVRFSDQIIKSDFSYAVIAGPGSAHWSWDQNAATIRLHTDSLDLTIERTTAALTFATKGGVPINADETGLTTSWQGTRVTAFKHLQPGERFIGLGEKTGNLDRAGNGYTNWNSDVYGYRIDQDPLYSTIPFYIGLHDTIVYGLFLDNSYRTDFNFGASNDRFSSFSAENGELNYYLIYHSTIAGILRSYTDLTGRMPMPPIWSLGYQQNRYSYYPDIEVLRIAQTLREKHIPADGITLDIHYMDHYKLFTWDKDRFPDPKEMTTKLKSMGFHTTVIVDPGIKVEKGYPAFESGTTADIFLKYPDKTPYTGQVWPGWVHFPDFTSEKGRGWWRSQIRQYTDAGVTGIWNDMNEPSTWGQKMPDNILFDFDGHPTTLRQGHNVFGLEMARSSFEGARAALGQRPFVLSRSGYAGLQRYAAIWTGDNRAEDDHMLAGVRLLTSLGISGVAFTGMDIGGFTGNPSAALYTRWMQLGAFIPYFRNHTALNSKAAEPWTFGEDILDITRQYIGLRYTLLPYLYSAFHEAASSGMPIARSLAIDYTRDPHIYDPRFQDEFLCGPGLLVMPQTGNAAFNRIYLPQGDWYDAYTGQRIHGSKDTIIELSEQRLPVYVKAGSVLPRESLIQNTAQQPADTLDLHCYAGPQPSSFVYYEDDGTSYDYEKGGYYQRIIRIEPTNRTITLEKPQGAYPSKFHYIRLLLHGFDNKTLQQQQTSFLPGDTQTESVQSTVITNSNETLSLIY